MSSCLLVGQVAQDLCPQQAETEAWPCWKKRVTCYACSPDTCATGERFQQRNYDDLSLGQASRELVFSLDLNSMSFPEGNGDDGPATGSGWIRPRAHSWSETKRLSKDL